MPYGENTDEDSNAPQHGAPVLYDRRQIAATKFQQQQERLPLQDALAMAKLQHEQAALQFQGQSELHAMQKETNLLRESSAYYAGLPKLQKYLDDRVAEGKTEFQKGGRSYAEAYANFAAQFPSAIAHNSEVAKDVADNAKVHDLAAQVNQNLAAVNNLKLQPGQSIDVGEQGARVHTSEKLGEIPATAREQYAKRKADVLFHEQTSLSQQKGAKGAFEYPDQPKLNAAREETRILESQFPGLSAPVTASAAAVTAPATQVLASGAAQTATPTPTPALTAPPTIRKYNPDTGELE